MSNSTEVPLLESIRLLWLNILSHGGHKSDSFITPGNSTPEDGDVSSPEFDLKSKISPTGDILSQLVNGQVSLRNRYIELGMVNGGDDGIWEWHLDLGFVCRVAFAPEVVWKTWVRNINEDSSSSIVLM